MFFDKSLWVCTDTMSSGQSVFLSHSDHDKPEVRRLAEDLRSAGVDVWFDESEIRVGQSIPQSIQQGLMQSDYLAVWLTEHAVTSEWVEREWQTRILDEVQERRTIVLPLRADNSPVPSLLKNKRYADFRTSYHAGLMDLLRSLRPRGESVTLKPVKVAILAGGLAERLWPLTNELPKALLRLAGSTVLHHLSVALNELENVEEIFVSVDENKAHFFQDVAAEIDQISNAKVSIVPHPLVDGKIMGPVAKLQELVTSGCLDSHPGRWNLVIGSDNIFTFSLRDLVLFSQKRGLSSNAVIEKRTAPKEFGIAQTTGEVLNSVMEKPNQSEIFVNKISTACYVYTGEDIARLEEYLSNNFGEDSLGSLIDWLCREVELLGCNFASDWVDIGTHNGLLDGNRLLVEKLARQPDFIPGEYQIRDPVYIENGVRIENSVVGPNVYLGQNCYIRDSEISNSVIYEGCQIVSCRPFEHIVAGPNSQFEGSVGSAVYGPGVKVSSYGER